MTLKINEVWRLVFQHPPPLQGWSPTLPRGPAHSGRDHRGSQRRHLPLHRRTAQKTEASGPQTQWIRSQCPGVLVREPSNWEWVQKKVWAWLPWSRPTLSFLVCGLIWLCHVKLHYQLPRSYDSGVFIVLVFAYSDTVGGKTWFYTHFLSQSLQREGCLWEVLLEGYLPAHRERCL